MAEFVTPAMVEVDLIPIGLVVGFLALIVIAVVKILGGLRARARVRDLQAWAGRNGFRFHPHGDGRLNPWYERFEVFRVGRERRAFNTLAGVLEIPSGRLEVLMGDYRYVIERRTGDKRRRIVRRFSYLICLSPWRDAPELLIRPEGIADRFSAFFGIDDIDFESEAFSRAFFVKSPDRRFAYDLIDPAMMQFLMETRPPLVDLENGALCLSEDRRLWEVPRFEQELGWVRDFFSRWPEHLVRRLEEGSA